MKSFVKFSPNDDNTAIHIEDLITGKQFLADDKVVYESIMYNDNLKILEPHGLASDTQEIYSFNSSLEHWFSRVWHIPLFFYLSSRNVEYFDKDDNGKEKRAALVQEYLKKDKCPEKYKPTGQEYTLPVASIFNPTILQYKQLALRRRSKRSFDTKLNCSIQELSDLLFNGLLSVKQKRELSIEEDILNYCDSYGISFDFYIVIFNIDGILPGIYYYDLIRHSLILIEAGCFRENMCDILQGMHAPKSANLTILFICDLMQYAWRYRHEKSLMNIYIQAGQICQEIIDAALNLDLQGLCTPATKDAMLNKYLKLNQYDYTPIYTLTLGK